MAIFYNNKIKSATFIPTVNSEFDFEIDTYYLLQNIEENGFEISLNHRQSMYIGMKENSVEILEESLKDFFKDAAEFFKKLAKKIIDFAKNAMKSFLSYFQDFDKFLKNNEDTLRSLNPNFTFKGFDYKFPDAPVLTKAYDIAGSYNIEINRMDSMKYADVLKMKDQFAGDSYKNEIRASILGSNNNVNADNFNDQSKLLFRSNKDAANITVNKSYVDMILREYSKLKTLLNETEAKKTKIVKMLNDFETFFLRKASVTYNNMEKQIQTNEIRTDDDKFQRGEIKTSNYSEESLKVLNAYFDLKYAESRFISNCLIHVYLDKVNAIRDCMKQYRAVIRQCLNKKSEPNTVETK